jgi:acetoacetyl-CoA synthetase
VGGISTQSVYAAEIQGPMLGVDVHAWSDDGVEVIDQVGELVICKPFPNMPLYFWNDEGDRRYLETYFSSFEGVWRHGDLIKFNDRGGCYIYGRSDATLNRFGVRIGTSEIYSIVNAIPGIADSLVVCCEEPDGGFYMPMFVKTVDGRALDDLLIAEIRVRLRTEASPRHVPDEIHQLPEIPYTLTGKKMEIPVRRILMGVAASAAASRESMNDPSLLDWFAAFRQRRMGSV